MPVYLYHIINTGDIYTQGRRQKIFQEGGRGSNGKNIETYQKIPKNSTI